MSGVFLPWKIDKNSSKTTPSPEAFPWSPAMCNWRPSPITRAWPTRAKSPARPVGCDPWPWGFVWLRFLHGSFGSPVSPPVLRSHDSQGSVDSWFCYRLIIEESAFGDVQIWSARLAKVWLWASPAQTKFNTFKHYMINMQIIKALYTFHKSKKEFPLCL